MKKLFFAMAAMAAMLTSCSKDDAISGLSHGKVTFEVSTPELTTRFGEGENAKNLYYAVYDVVETPAGTLVHQGSKEFETESLTTTVTIDLVEGRQYEVAFWAESPESPYVFKPEEKKVCYKQIDNLTANNEAYDAFFAYVPESKVVVGSSISVELKRPFAQLNVATNDTKADENGVYSVLGVQVAETGIVVENVYTSFNLQTGEVDKNTKGSLTFKTKSIGEKGSLGSITTAGNAYNLLSMNYILVNERENVDVTFNFTDSNDKEYTRPYAAIPVQRNYRTNVIGSILTSPTDFNVEITPGVEGVIEHKVVNVNKASDLAEVIAGLNNDANNEPVTVVLTDDISLDDLVMRAADPSLTIPAGKTLTIDLGGKKLSATSTQSGGNYSMILVNGTLTVANGTITTEHTGNNMGWNSMTTIFDVTAGGVLNLEGVTAKNLGGSDMGFVAHLNNWGEVTLNVENCTLESNYVPVRVFNSGPDMNNVTIKNSTLKGSSAAFWVHNYTVADFGTEAKAEAQKALLNLNIFDESNTFSPIVGIRYGFTNSIRTDSYGITKSVSEDGTEVTLGVMFGEGVVRAGVAGNEGDNTIKKVIVEEGITSLPNRTFKKFKALETVELPSTLTILGSEGDAGLNGNVFQGCSALKNIVIPEAVTTMGPGVFYGCSSLESINIPAGVTRIEKDALRETGLKKVEFHADVTYFGDMAFRDCESLEEIVINAPSFEVASSNTFLNASAPYPAYTIRVANAEMKAYVESKLDNHHKTFITVKAPVAVTDKASLQAAMAEAIKDGEKNIYIDGTNFSGDLNYGFSNANLPAGVTVTIRNAKVTATSKWNYLNGTLIFEDCEFTAGLYSIHFDDDDGVGDVIFKNCKLVGWLPFAAINSVSFEDCTLTGNGSYALIRSYADLTLTNCTIDTTLANHTDQYSDGVEALDGAALTENNVTYIDNHTAYLQNVLAAGKNVVLSSDITINEGITAPYGNKTALDHKGGVFNGNGKTITSNITGDSYILMTNGGTIKDVTVTGAFRGVMIMSANQTVYLDNVVSGGKGVVYALNTGEGDSTQDLIATNCTFNGWSSWSLLKSATFTNCTFGQGAEYSNVTGRIARPYVNTLFDGCKFVSKFYIDLSALTANQKVTLKNCTVNGVKLTAENWTSLVAPEDTCGEGQISIELKDGTFMTADNVADYVIFE